MKQPIEERMKNEIGPLIWIAIRLKKQKPIYMMYDYDILRPKTTIKSKFNKINRINYSIQISNQLR